MDLQAGLIVFFAGVAASALNSIAGGGSFITFPALLSAGVPPVMANATSTFSVWLGGVGSIGGYRRELAESRRFLPVLATASALGGVSGALLLLLTPERAFAALIPWMLLTATLLFSFGAQIGKAVFGSALGRRLGIGGIALFQFFVAVYGGYYGAGIGILMLAAFSVLNLGSIHIQNGLKVVLGMLINGVAAVTLAIAGAVRWPEAAVMTVGCVLGGYYGASFARRLPPVWVRRSVIAIGAGLTAFFFARPI
jgi:hypothetical protein